MHTVIGTAKRSVPEGRNPQLADGSLPKPNARCQLSDPEPGTLVPFRKRRANPLSERSPLDESSVDRRPHSNAFTTRCTSKIDSGADSFRPHRRLVFPGIFVWLLFFCGSHAMAQNEVTLETIDETSGTPVPARIEFLKSAKRLKVDRKVPSVGDTWLSEESLVLQPSSGDFEFLALRGPEFKEIRGGFTIEGRSKDSVAIEIPRAVDMHAEEWFSGDLSCEWDPQQSWRWQVADAIDMVVESSLAVAKTAVNKKQDAARSRNASNPAPAPSDPDLVGHRWQSFSKEVRLPEIGFAVHRNAPPDKTEKAEKEIPGEGNPLSKFLDAIRVLEESLGEPNALIEITQMAARDVPLMLAHPRVKLARILNSCNRPKKDDVVSHPKRESPEEFARVMATFGKEKQTVSLFAPIDEKDRIRFKSPRAAGMISEYLYWQMLEAGLRLVPTAASGFGRVDTYLGYNRIYAYCDSEKTPEGWWKGVESGSVFVTNGPLLRTLINGVPPGAVQAVYDGEPLPLSIAVSLAVREPVDYLDVVFNGETLYSAKLEEHYRKGEFPEITIDKSGWLVIRVITEHEDGYRMATTAPFYYEVDGKPRISRRAVEFFQTWLARSVARIEQDETLAIEYRPSIERAKQFWTDRLEQANAP